MKKIITSLTILMFLWTFSANSMINNEYIVENIQSENIKVLSEFPPDCYFVYGEGFLIPTKCCEPWYWYCFSFGGIIFDGWPTF